ncbi:MAG: glycoside hydrolase family 97 catalytic domain-containing protein, partial [Gammaproteobacteria bacterium]|nr:glycoside hydrolase family 97 catalytic domain-containing protein [Gammaproteobacteria bacterium]
CCVATLGNMPDIPCGPRLASGRLWARYSRMILNLNEPNAPGAPLIGHHETSGHVSNYERQLSDAFSLYGHLGVTMVKTGYVADTRRLKRNDERGVEHFEYHDGQFAVGHHLRVSRLRVREHQSSTV